MRWLGEVQLGGEGPHWTVVPSKKKNKKKEKKREEMRRRRRLEYKELSHH